MYFGRIIVSVLGQPMQLLQGIVDVVLVVVEYVEIAENKSNLNLFWMITIKIDQNKLILMNKNTNKK